MAPTVRSFSAAFEPLRLSALRPESYPALLESTAPPGVDPVGRARFDILPMSNGEILELDAARQVSGPYAAPGAGFLDALEAWWTALRVSPSRSFAGSALPFSGGWLLYLGYELASEAEPRLQLPASPEPCIAVAIRAPAAWIRDRRTGAGWLVAEPGAEALLERFERDVARAGSPRAAAAPLRCTVAEEHPARFVAAVVRALEHIAAGEVYQVNISRQWQVNADRAIVPADVYERLRAANPSPFAALFQHRDIALMSSSPERLLAIRDGVVSTRPIAGTRPRGATAAADAALLRTLLGSEKERAEHVMLIDLERNDLGRVCVAGSVAVDEYMAVESYAHVHHIVSNVCGRLRPEVSPVQAIRALFPGGTITGCPKIRCMEIIAALEGCGRGAYTGSLGYLNRDGSCDLNILIRTLSARLGGERRQLTFRTGAGIVADSDPLLELAETRAKAKGMLRALDGPT